MRPVDLNADVGELAAGPGVETGGLDHEGALIGSVSSVHVACGFHAGDAHVMEATIVRAVRAGVAIGAHPSYPDRPGFGRRPMSMAPAEVAEDVLYQLGALGALARRHGVRLRSVKPHGALYHRMAVDEPCTAAVAEAVRSYDEELALVLAAGSAGLDVVADVGLRAIGEAFCDRAYLPDGSLAPRSQPGAVLTDVEAVSRRAVLLVLDGVVETVEGGELRIDPGTLCIHGDTPGAPGLAAAVREALGQAGVQIAPPPSR
ncbi:MAG TPA: 5-oxoprolinase subunit PxpA [Acidimicrobiales bacterium]|jgi:UPF0271 protein